MENTKSLLITKEYNALTAYFRTISLAQAELFSPAPRTAWDGSDFYIITTTTTMYNNQPAGNSA